MAVEQFPYGLVAKIIYTLIMDKQEIKDQLLEAITKDIEQAEKNYKSSKQLSQSSDMKQESKYDTRSTEAGYLASAQKQRLEDLKLEQKLIEEIDISPIGKDDPITMGTLVKIRHNDLERFYFLASTAGGTPLKIDDITLLVISVFSPLGKEILGLKSGDEFEIEHGDQLKEYEIISAE